MWEIDSRQLIVENKVGSGSYGDLYVLLSWLISLVVQTTDQFMSNFFRYKGSYCSQEVAIKVLKPEHVNAEMLREFSQEVYIMRLV